MTEEEATDYVHSIMETFGISVFDIPRSTERKTPDFEFSFESERYVVEMKQREAEWVLTEDEGEAFDAGDVVHKSESIYYFKNLASKVRKGSVQIEAYEPNETSFRIVLYFLYGQRAALAAQRLSTTLLGDVCVHELDSKRQWHAHFFDSNLFQQLENAIDGVIILRLNYVAEGEVSTNFELVLNPFSPRYLRLKESRLATVYPESVIDSFKLEKMGKVLIADYATDRSSERDTINYLGIKYGINVPQLLRMGHMTAIIKAPSTD